MLPLFFVLLILAQTFSNGVESYRIFDEEHSINKRETEDPKFQHLFFIGCKGDDEIDGLKLSSIVDYAVSKMDITFKKSDDSKKTYEEYASALQKKMGGGDPHQVSVELKGTHTKEVLKEMTKALNMKSELIPQKLKDMIEMSVKRATGYDETEDNSFDSLLHVSKSDSSSQTEFAILEINKSEDSVQITSRYMSVKGEKVVDPTTEEKAKWTDKKWGKANIDSMEMSFMLTKYAIAAISKIIKSNQ